MTLLPIVERELRVAARRRGTYWVRFGVGLLAILICGWMLLTMPLAAGASRTSGLQVFGVLAGLGFVFCLSAGAYATADCLSAEKREGTLGLLFLTDLKGYDVVLGKLAATSLGTIYSLLAMLPIIALPLLLGGVSPQAVLLVGLALPNALFFSLAAGLFASAVSRDERKTVTGAFALVLLIAGGLPLIGGLIEETTRFPWRYSLAWTLYVPSPGTTFVTALQAATSTRGSVGYWWSLLAVHAQAWLLLGLACWILPRTWSERSAEVAKPGSWRARWRDWCYGNAYEKKLLRERLLEINPIAWLSGRNRFSAVAPWILLLILGIGWLAGYCQLRRDWLEVPVAIGSALALHGLLKYQLAGEACRRFAEDRRCGALELVLSTPLSVREIVRGQLAALRRQFGGPLAVMLAVDALLLWSALQKAGYQGSPARELKLAFLSGMFVLVADAFTLSWLGMWRGLRASSYIRAWGGTMFWVLVLPWAVFLVSMITVESLGLWRRWTPGFGTVLGWWVFLSLANDLILLGWAWRKLSNEFRAEATRRFQPGVKTAWWRFWSRN